MASKIGNRKFAIGNFRTEFGQKIRQPFGPILRITVAYKKKEGVGVKNVFFEVFEILRKNGSNDLSKILTKCRGVCLL